VGANSRLGELFAHDLPALRKDFGYSGNPLPFPNLPADFSFDNPKENMESGTLCSAGGHYEGLFTKKEDAIRFCDEAAKLIKRELPGIQFGITIKKFPPDITYEAFEEIPFQSVDTSAFPEPFFNLPDLQISSDDGTNPVNPGSNGNSDLIDHMNAQKIKFFNGDAKDFLCQFLNTMDIRFWPTGGFEFDTEKLSALSTTRNRNQIAMIVMDGNRMGVRFRKKLDEIKAKSVMEAFIESERFWLASRNKIRTALKAVLKKIYEDLKGGSPFPVWPIFLGGDDVMLLSTPELALELVLLFIEELKKTDPEHTVSAGIAVVKESYPLAQAHELAESCLSSAKKEAYRTGKSAVDWHILYDSRTIEIEEIRRRDYMLSYDLDGKTFVDILSCRPCIVEKAGKLCNDAREIVKKVGDEERGMNKYKALRTILRQGRPMAEYQMKQLGIDDGALQFKKEEITIDDKMIRCSQALDVIELCEFYRTTKAEGE